MINDNIFCVTEKEIGGTTYIVESATTADTKATAESIIERLILSNLKLSECSQ